MQYLANTMTAFVQDFVKSEKMFYITSKDMLTITKEVYENAISMEEAINDTTYEYNVIAEKHEDTVSRDSVGHWFYGYILNDLCYRKLIEPGKYFIRYTW